MSSVTVPEANAAQVEVAILDGFDPGEELPGQDQLERSKAAANSEDVQFGEEAPGQGQLEKISGKESAGSQGHTFWHFSMHMNIAAFLTLFSFQVVHHYAAVYMEHSSFPFKIYLRGVPWLPELGAWSLSAAVYTAFNVQGESLPWPWKSIMVIFAVFSIGSVACFAIPGVGIILAGASMSTVLIALQVGQDRYLLKRMGRSSQEMKQFAKCLVLLYGTAYISTNLGAAALVLFGVFGKLLPVFAELLLTLWLAGTERLCLIVAMKGAKHAPDFAPPRLLSYILLFASAELEGFRLACVMSSVMRNPKSFGYLAVLLSGLIVNMGFRTGWTNYALARLIGPRMFAANIPNLILREVKLVSGYGRMAFPAGLMVARLCHGSTELPWYFNETLLVAMALAFFLMILEDASILAMKKLDWLAPLGDLEKAHYTGLPEGSLLKAYTWSDDNKATPTFTSLSPPKMVELCMQLFAQTAASCMAFWGLAPLVSMKYLYGLDSVASANALDGAFLWLSD